MKQYTVALASLILSTLILPTQLYAEPPNTNKQQHRQADAHIHGVAELTLALENNLLEIQFQSPANNIIGFEHKAKTQQDIDTALQAQALLEQPDKLFSFIGSACTLQDQNVDISSVLSPTDDHDEHDDHDNHDDHEGHSEITSNYKFVCQKGSQLQTISMDLLEHFSGIEALNAMWVTADQQGAARLTAQSNILNLRQK